MNTKHDRLYPFLLAHSKTSEENYLSLTGSAKNVDLKIIFLRNIVL